MKYWKIGTTKNIAWSFPDVLSNVKIELSRNNGSSWETISASTDNDGSFPWVVDGDETEQALIKISGLEYTDPVDESQIDFTDIYSTSSPFGISLTKDTPATARRTSFSMSPFRIGF